MYSLRMSFWESAAQIHPLGALFLGRHEEEGEDRLSGPVDRHRHRRVVERNPREELLHVLNRVDGYAAVSDLAAGTRAIRVETHQRRHIERHRQPVLAGRQQVPEPGVRLYDRAETCELADGPQLAAISGRVNAPGIWEGPWVADRFRVDAVWTAESRHVFEREGHEFVASLAAFIGEGNHRARVLHHRASAWSSRATSALQLGQIAVGTSPTMKEKEHWGHAARVGGAAEVGRFGAGGAGGRYQPTGPRRTLVLCSDLIGRAAVRAAVATGPRYIELLAARTASHHHWSESPATGGPTAPMSTRYAASCDKTSSMSDTS